MRDAFAYVLFATAFVGIVIALGTLLWSGRAYEEIGKGGFYKADGDQPAAGSAADLAERDAEIRQMLEARNARRAAAGGDVVDVEAELARLTAPAIDAQLRQEIREHVVAGNARRIRRGQQPLDVDAEVERQVRALGGLQGS